MKQLILLSVVLSFLIANEGLQPSNNITSGSTSVIIQNGQLTKGKIVSQKEEKVIPCELEEIEIEVKQVSLTLKPTEKECRISYYPKDLKVELEEKELEIEGDGEKFASISVNLNKLKKLVLKNGGEVYIFTPLSKLSIKSMKEASIYLLSYINELELSYEGELSLQVGKLEKLKVKGKGNLILIGESEFPIQKEIQGTLIKVKEKE
ncbi:MAG: hypothetical protein GXO61_03835 [Epsilonproteobacteria bacterium]|nr:hypothetical protein [Campylobacterota bacterium]